MKYPNSFYAELVVANGICYSCMPERITAGNEVIVGWEGPDRPLLETPSNLKRNIHLALKNEINH